MTSNLVLLMLSVAVGFPLVAVGAKRTLGLIRRMETISRLSAWVARVVTLVGLAVSILIGLAVLVSGHGYFAPLASLGSACFVELVVASQLRNGISLWERRERGRQLVHKRAVMSQIEERLKSPGVSTVEKAALRVQRSILRWLNLAPKA